MGREFEFGPLEWPVGFHFPSGGKPTKRKPSGPPKKPKPKLPPVGPSVPFYAVIKTLVFPTGSLNAHHTDVSLSAAAVAAGATIAVHLRDAGNFGGGNEVHEITVMQFPKLVQGLAFSVRMSGAVSSSTPTPPGQICASAVLQRNVVQVTNDTDPNVPAFIAGFSWAIPGTAYTGSGGTYFTANYDAAEAFRVQYGSNPYTVTESFLFVPDGHGGYNTNFASCDTPSEHVLDGFDTEIKLYPQQDLTVRTSLLDWRARFHEIDAILGVDPAKYPSLDPDYGSKDVALYDDDKIASRTGGDLNNGTYPFNMVSQPYTVLRPTTNVFMVYPPTLNTNLYGPPDFRLMNSPYVGTPIVHGFDIWDDRFTWGAPPPVSNRDVI